MRNPRSSQFFQNLIAENAEMYSGNINYANIGRTPTPSLMSAPTEQTPIDFSERPNRGPRRTGNSSPGPKTPPNNEPMLMSMPTPPAVDPALIFTAGTVDYSFPAGGGYGNDGFDDSVYVIKVDADGKYLVGGNFANYYYNGSTYYSPYLIRLNPDGSVDGSFNTTNNPDCYGGGLNGNVYGLQIQSDGKILVGGNFTNYDKDGNCNTANRIIRLNTDGSRDLTFSTGNGFNDDVYDIELQPDGKILVAGYFTSYNGTDAYRIIRLNSNGSIDSSFAIGDTNISFDNYVNDIKLQSDGKIIAVGNFTSYGITNRNYIVRINSDGTPDTTFYVGNGFNNEAYVVEIQSDGKIIVGGSFDEYDNNTLYGGYIVRLNTNGSIDTLFGYGLNDYVTSLAIQSDGKILVGGYFGTFYPTQYNSLGIDELVRFHSDGTLDYSFYYQELLDNNVESIVILEDGKILIGGNFGDNTPSTFPLNYFGRLNNSILPYKYTYLMNDCDQPLNDSTVTYIVGSNVELNNNDSFSFTSIYNPSVVKCGYISGGDYDNQYFYSNQVDYVLDNVYNTCDDAKYANSKIAYTTDLLDLGEGYNLLVDSKYQAGDILYVDLVFDFIGGVTFIKTAVVIDSIGNYLPNNYFTSPIIPYAPYDTLETAVVSNGIHYVVEDCTSPETNFPLIHKFYSNNTPLLIPTGDNPCKEVVDVLTFAPYYLISGGTNELNSTVEFTSCDECLTKMGKSGLVDYTLYNNNLNNFVYTMVEQPDGKILVGGNFDTINGINTGSMVRLNVDGTLDETFNTVFCNQPAWSTETPFDGTSSGSIYFDGTPLCGLSGETDVIVWDFNNNNLTFEWFQKFEGDITETSTIFDYRNNDLRVYFTPGYINVSIDGDSYPFELNSSIENAWCHIAITRYYDGDDYIWRVFQNGIELGQFLYTYNLNQGNYLVVGNTQYYDINYKGFNGYVTNFRVNNGEAIYTSNFDVPTSPLDPNYNAGGGNTVICLSVNNEPDYILDSCDDNITTSVNNSEYYYFWGFSSYVRAIALQPDGKILVGGNFNYYNSQYAGKIIRLNSDGSIDQDFTYSDEFNNKVRAIAVQRDGKIVVGGDFNYYYDFYCNHIVRLNPDGTPDETFVTNVGFDGSVYSITLEDAGATHYPYTTTETGDNTNSLIYVPQNIVVGGWFETYDEVTSRGVAILNHEGTLLNNFGTGFNYETGDTPRVNQIFKQSDGKLIVVGGANDGGYLFDYQGTYIPRNIVRLFDDGFNNYIIDDTFELPPYYNGEGGFNEGYALSVTQQSDDKLIISGNFSRYLDNNDEYTGLYNIVRIHTDGTYDPTFSMGEGFDGQVNKVLMLSDGKLLTGGWYQNPYPTDYLTRLYVGEEYKLRTFTECNGDTGYIYTPSDYIPAGTSGDEFTATTIDYSPISTDGLTLVPGDYPDDDSNYFVELPLGFDIIFLGDTYTSINVGTNSYLTFGGGSDSNGIDIPSGIPNETGLPGIYLSTRTDGGTCLDSELYGLYTGLTDGGNTYIARFEGNDDYSPEVDPSTNLIYNFKFYKDNPEYFDLIIESNKYFCNDDPTGGVSNGVDETWVVSFDTSSEKAYRIGIYSNSLPIKADLGTTPKLCGQVGSVVTGNPEPTTNLVGGSMSFDGTNGNVVTVDYNVAMDLDYDSWTIEWFQYYTSTDACCRRVFDIGTFPNEHIGVSIENGSIVVWIERTSGPQYSYALIDPIYNTWSHFAISAEDIGSNNRVIRVFQNGVQLGSSQTFNLDMNNFDGPTLLPLIIGGMGNGNDTFQGQITNFRWNKGTCYYTNNFTVPTQPLSVDGSQLLLLSTNQSGLIYDSSETQTISQNNVTWSENTPFGTYLLSSASDTTSYSDCTTCVNSVDYNVTLYVRNSLDGTTLEYRTMTKEDLDNVLNNGPIFTTKGPECYEIINYNI